MFNTQYHHLKQYKGKCLLKFLCYSKVKYGLIFTNRIYTGAIQYTETMVEWLSYLFAFVSQAKQASENDEEMQ